MISDTCFEYSDSIISAVTHLSVFIAFTPIQLPNTETQFCDTIKRRFFQRTNFSQEIRPVGEHREPHELISVDCIALQSIHKVQRDSYMVKFCPKYRCPSQYCFSLVDTIWFEASSAATKESHKFPTKSQRSTYSCAQPNVHRSQY